MREYPIVVREIAGEHRLGVEDAEEFDADLRDVIAEAYGRIDVEAREDGEQVGTVVAKETAPEIETVRWRD